MFSSKIFIWVVIQQACSQSKYTGGGMEKTNEVSKTSVACIARGASL